MKPNISQLRTVDGETLMSQPLRPPDFVVSGLLSKGLHILAGSPKVGKSWLALWLAVTVAKGEPVWGMNTRQGTTLYLCLEDSVLRIQTGCSRSRRRLHPASTFAQNALLSGRDWRSRSNPSCRSIPERCWSSSTHYR